MSEQVDRTELSIDLNGKVAVITGGSRGIGRATALTLARAGARIAAISKTESDASRSLADDLKAAGTEALMVAADVTSRADVDRAVEAVRDRFGSVDILVNNAGSSGRAPIAEMAEEEWQRLIDSDLTSVFRVTKAFLPLMNEGGSIVIISGAVAEVGQPGLAHYAAAKAGTVGFMRTLMKEVGKQNIRANVIASGIVNTDRLKRLPPEAQARYAGMTALGRVAQPQDIANVVAFLAGDLAGFVTGAVIHADGGT